MAGLLDRSTVEAQLDRFLQETETVRKDAFDSLSIPEWSVWKTEGLGRLARMLAEYVLNNDSAEHAVSFDVQTTYCTRLQAICERASESDILGADDDDIATDLDVVSEELASRITVAVEKLQSSQADLHSASNLLESAIIHFEKANASHKASQLLRDDLSEHAEKQAAQDEVRR